MIKRILVALSGTPFTASAIEHAIELAQRHGASVTGVTDVDVERLSDTGPTPIGAGGAAHALAEHRILATRQKIDEQIERFQAQCRKGEVEHQVDLETGDAFEKLLSLWRYHDFTIMGLRGLFEYGVVQNPDDQLVHLLAKGLRPILAVAEAPRRVNDVLVAYDGSMESAKTMKRFVQMRLWPEAKVRIVCVDMKDDKALPLLADAMSYCRAHGYDAESEAIEGNPIKMVVEHARETGADLIVMGATSRGKLARFVWGDTALHTLRNAEIPIFMSQ